MTGLYTTIGCLVGYAVFGPSRVLVLGPDSSVSPLIFAAITPLIVTGDPDSAVVLAGMLGLLVGLIEIGLGVARLGFVADLLSSEVQVGYMNGLAITIVVGQLPKLFGFSTDADSFVDEIRAFVDHLDETQTAALLVGLGALVVLLGPAEDHTEGSRGARRGGGRDDPVGGARACRRRCGHRRVVAERSAAADPAVDLSSATWARCCSPRSGSCWCRSPTPSRPPRASRRGAATSSNPTRR